MSDTHTKDQLSALCAQLAAAAEKCSDALSNSSPDINSPQANDAHEDAANSCDDALTAYRAMSPDPQWQRVPEGYEVVAKTPAAVVNPDDAPMTEEKLVNMMRDPRYWKTRDPEILAKVTEGFRRLYPDNRARGEG